METFYERLNKSRPNSNKTDSRLAVLPVSPTLGKKDLDKFPILKEYVGKDISYIVTESIEIL